MGFGVRMQTVRQPQLDGVGRTVQGRAVEVMMTSAGVSRMTRARNGSTSALPPRPRLRSSTPARRAATAGQVSDGATALDPWLIELP
jgi:hypothetical protein